MYGKLITAQIKLIRLAILPGILGGIACFIGPDHHVLIKVWIGVVIGLAIQRSFMLPVIKDAPTASDELFNKIFEDDD